MARPAVGGDLAVERVTDDIRARVLRAIIAREGELDPIFRAMAERVRRDLRASGYTVDQVESVLRAAFDRSIEDRIAIAARSIEEGAAAGAGVDRAIFDRFIGRQGVEPNPGRFRFPADQQARRIAAARIRGDASIDNLSLSQRFHANDEATIDRMRRQIVSSIRSGEAMLTTADRILEADDPAVEIPEHVAELRDEARRNRRVLGGILPADELLDAVDRWRGRINRLGEVDPSSGSRVGAFTIRSATQELVRRLERAAPEQVDTLVNRWVLDRARYQARLVVRTETVEAYREAAIESTSGRPWVVGYRWRLGNRHPKADECDVFAGQNLHGLGPGGYPAADIPVRHPADLCVIDPIVDRHFNARERAIERGLPEPPRHWEIPAENPGDWYRANPEIGREILGPTRWKAFNEDGASAALFPTGRPKPVWMVLGEEGPAERGTGVRVRVRALVRADAARRRRALPRAPELAVGDLGTIEERRTAPGGRLAEARARDEARSRAASGVLPPRAPRR